MESAIFHTKAPLPSAIIPDHQQSPSTIQRILKQQREEIADDNRSIERIYSNVSTVQQNESPIINEGDEIEHDLLSLVEEEEQKDKAPPPLPEKKRASVITNVTPVDLNIEPTTKLTHFGKDRPRRQNIQRPKKKPTDTNIFGDESVSEENNETNLEPPSTPYVRILIFFKFLINHYFI